MKFIYFLLGVLGACALSTGSGPATVSISREIGVDTTIEANASAASAPYREKK
jgi:hypothetical protein